MAGIYPGQRFEIKFGNDQRLTVRALTGKQQEEEFGPLFQDVVNAEVSANVVDSIAAAKKLLEYIAGTESAAKLWTESVDARMVIEIATKVLERIGISEDDEKK